MAIVFVDRSHIADHKSRSVLLAVHAVDRLPPGYLPCGPGVPYEYQELHRFKTDAGGYSSYVTIDDTGRIWPTKYYGVTERQIRTRRNGRIVVPHAGWVGEKPDAEGHLWSVTGAAITFSAWKMAQWSWVARLWRGECNVRVAIADNRVKEIFADRERADGNRATHWVRAHFRRLKGGRKTVTTHMRGAVGFRWRGHYVTIHLPGEAPRRGLSVLAKPCYTQAVGEYGTTDATLASLFQHAGLKWISRRALHQVVLRDLRGAIDVNDPELVQRLENNEVRNRPFYYGRDTLQ
jgi:hypothetical protein